MHDIRIGEGNFGNSWCLSRDLIDKCYISKGYYSYCCSNIVLDQGILIHYNCNEGKELTKMLVNCASNEEIHKWLMKQYILHIEPNKLIKVIQNSIEHSFHEGVRHCKRELRNFLGV